MERTVAAATAAVLALGAPARADSLPVPLPKALVFPNYDNVLLGKDQALEGGSYIARAGDASANFYNPAGLVQSERTSLNASTAGWVRTKLTAETTDVTIVSSRIDTVPGYFGIVIDPPFLKSRNFRLGASITRSVAWDPGDVDQSAVTSSIPQIDRVTWSTSASFSTQVYQLAAAWSPWTR
jgi:hypothetical protein